jgi:hypothetical protein
MNYEFNNFIGIFHNAVHPNLCDNIINYYEDAHKVNLAMSRRTSDGSSKTLKDTSQVFHDIGLNSPANVDQLDALTNAYNFGYYSKHMLEATKYIGQCHSIYAEEYDILSTVDSYSIDHTLKVQKTSPGGGYHVWHCEHGGAMYGRRLLSVAVYLNDVEEGGETEFLYQRLRIKPTKGTVLIFPPSYTHTHRGNPPLRGDKYMITTWFNYNDNGPNI